jgi:hypothetical protein
VSNPGVQQNRKLTDPNLADLLNLHGKQLMLNMNCHAIATVQSFDADQQTVSATINYKKTYLTRNADGTYSSTLIDYPILLDVPIVILSGGPAQLTFPIAQGDECLILFNDRSLDNWFQSGQVGPVSSTRLHSISDGFALVGVRSLARSIDSYDETHAKIAWGETMVGVSANKVKIANQLYTLNTLLQSLLTQVQAITVTAVTPGIGVSGPPANAAAIAAIAVQIGALLE